MAARDLLFSGHEESHGNATGDLKHSRPTRAAFFMQ